MFGATSSLALAACVREVSPEQAAELCKKLANTVAKSKGDLIVDAHCHLLNLQDVNGADFVVRRIADIDESDFTDKRKKQDAATYKKLIGYAQSSVPGIRIEKDKLRSELLRRGRLKSGPNAKTEFDANTLPKAANVKTCEFGAVRPAGKLLDTLSAAGSFDGLISTRLRNAVSLMQEFPGVHLFTPSMIDFDEGKGRGDRIQEMRFYALLNLASQGRFVPLVSFAPLRPGYQKNKAGRLTAGRPMN